MADAPANHKPNRPKPELAPTPDETIKETFESIIIAFVLAFVFRAFVVEAFVIPTGSMAPTLLGEHIRMQCPECGYAFDAEVPKGGGAVMCPMTGHRVPIATGKRTAAAGDRILVHKYIYRFSEPRRWDVVVFKNPSNPQINYIKRLIGLPEESLYLLDGNVYTRSVNSEKWRIARKTERPKVQRAVWRPIYHSDYVPIDPEKSVLSQSAFKWRRPWNPADDALWDMSLNGGRSYRFFGGENAGQIDFSFDHWGRRMAMRGMYSYDQTNSSSWSDYVEPIEDVRIATTVRVEDPAQPVRLALQTTGRLEAGPVPLSAVIEADGRVRIIAGDPQSDDARTLADQTTTPLHERGVAEVEFWFVDQEASVWVDGELVLRERFNYTLEELLARPEPITMRHKEGWPKIAIRVEGSPVTLSHVEVDRDLYYAGIAANSGVARGALFRESRPPLGVPAGQRDQRLDIAADEFFCVGDNGPLSLDGRFWGRSKNDGADPWVIHRYFDDNESKDGVVPRDLMMGRAFFVYWPAPYPFKPNGFGVLPNFGDMRFIH